MEHVRGYQESNDAKSATAGTIVRGYRLWHGVPVKRVWKTYSEINMADNGKTEVIQSLSSSFLATIIVCCIFWNKFSWKFRSPYNGEDSIKECQKVSYAVITLLRLVTFPTSYEFLAVPYRN